MEGRETGTEYWGRETGCGGWRVCGAGVKELGSMREGVDEVEKMARGGAVGVGGRIVEDNELLRRGHAVWGGRTDD